MEKHPPELRRVQRNVVTSVLEAQFPGAKDAVKRVLEAGGLIEFGAVDKEAQDKRVDSGNDCEERSGGIED